MNSPGPLLKTFSIILIMGSSAVADDDPYREWTSKAGSKIEAALVSMNAITAEVTLRKRDGSLTVVKIDQLTLLDSEFIDEQTRKGKTPYDNRMGEKGQPTSVEEITEAARSAARSFLEFPTGSEELEFEGLWFRGAMSSNTLEAIQNQLTQALTLSQPIERKRIPNINFEDNEGDQIASGIISHLCWWDSVGLLSLGRKDELDEKVEYIDRKLRWDESTGFRELPEEIFDFLENEHDGHLIGLNASVVDHTTPALLEAATSGLDLVITTLDATNQRLSSVEWVNQIAVIQVNGEEITFQMWGEQFEAVMEQIPDRLNIGREFSPVELKLIPDPLNEQISYIANNEWRLFLARETVLISPVPTGQPTR